MVALQTEVRPLVGVVLQTLAFHYGFEVEDLSVRDVFVAKYAAVGAHQDRLPLHRDGNLLSFSILTFSTFHEHQTKQGDRWPGRK